MPRRSSRSIAQEEPAGERRVTRRSVQEANPNASESKKSSRTRTASHSPSPSSTSSTTSSKRGQSGNRGRRGRSTGRGGRGKKVAEQPEDEELEDEAEVDETEEKQSEPDAIEDKSDAGDATALVAKKTKTTPTKAKSPRGRPKGSAKSPASTPKKRVTDLQEEKIEAGDATEEAEESGNRRSSRTRSSPRSQQPERRRSNRAATIAAAVKPFKGEDGDEEDDEQEGEQEGEQMEVDTEPPKVSPRKRKREDDSEELENSPKKIALQEKCDDTGDDNKNNSEDTREDTSSPTRDDANTEKLREDAPSLTKDNENGVKPMQDTPSPTKDNENTEKPPTDNTCVPEDKFMGVQVDEVESSEPQAEPPVTQPDTPPAEPEIAEKTENKGEGKPDETNLGNTDQQTSMEVSSEAEKITVPEDKIEAKGGKLEIKGDEAEIHEGHVEMQDEMEVTHDEMEVTSATPDDSSPSLETTQKNILQESESKENILPSPSPVEDDVCEPDISTTPVRNVTEEMCNNEQNEVDSMNASVSEMNSASVMESQAPLITDQTQENNQVEEFPIKDATPQPSHNKTDEMPVRNISPEPNPNKNNEMPLLDATSELSAKEAESAVPVHDAEDFVMVMKDDLPAADSAEVQGSTPVAITTHNSDEAEHLSTLAQLDGQTANTPLAVNGFDTENSDKEQAPVSDTNISQSQQSTNNHFGHHKSAPLAHRNYVSNPSIDSDSISNIKQFSLVSYNILADCHAQRWRDAYPFAKDEDISQDIRHQLLMEELTELSSDIYCLQEVGSEYYVETLSPALKRMGYESKFTRRTGADFNEGSATFVKSSRFTLLDSHDLILHDAATKDMKAGGVEEDIQLSVENAISCHAVALLTHLRCTHTKANVTVANIHTEFDNFVHPDKKCIQVACAIRELVSMAGGADKPHIICGDFNSTPDSSVYQLTKEGYLNDSSVTKLQEITSVNQPEGQRSPLVNCWWKGFQHTSNNLCSAYATICGDEPVSTRYPSDGGLRAVDYIWYGSNSLQLLDVLEAPQSSLLQPGIPSITFPSDHISIRANLAFL